VWRAALICLAAASACGRLEHVGQPPPFTPSGQIYVEQAPMTPERIALATPAPAEVAAMRAPIEERPRTRSASLWRSGPTSLFGDRRANSRGDILTVVIEIDEEATIRNATQRTRTGAE